jgi:hypothetical protein
MRFPATVIAALAVAMTACGSEQDASAPTTPEPRQEAEQEASAPTEPRCKRASKRLLSAIEAGLEVSGGEGSLRRGYIVRSEDFSKVYLVAADIQGPGMEGRGDVGVWATNSPRAEGLIFAVDGMAQEFSDWGDADKTDAAIDQSAHGVDEARRCAEG